jgi:hypothetical protein
MPDPFYVWRSGNAYPGEKLYFWSPTGQLAVNIGDYTADPELVLTIPPTRRWVDTNTWVMAMTVDPGAPPGAYTLQWTDPIDHVTLHTITVTVVAAPSSIGPVTIPAGATTSYIQSKIDAGYSPIILSPGNYDITTALQIGTGTPADVVVIDGQGWASFTRQDEPGSYHNQTFNVGHSLTIKGIHFREGDFTLATYGLAPLPVDVNVVECRFENCGLGQGYCDPTNLDPMVPILDVGGVLVDRCEFVRANAGNPTTATVFDQCLFRESNSMGSHPIYNIFSLKWLMINTDFVRTPRGLVGGGITSNGVAAACRFFEIAQAVPNGGEVILFERYSAGPPYIENNAFVWCAIYDCSGPGIQIYGGAARNNFFKYIFVHTKINSIVLVGADDIISGNRFEYIEMGADLSVTGHCSANVFSHIVALRQPLQSGHEVPGVASWGMPNYQARPPFADTSTQSEGEAANSYSHLYESRHDGILQVWTFPNVLVIPE